MPRPRPPGQLEHLVDRTPEGSGDAKCQRQRRYIPSLLEQDDRLARAPDSGRQLLLGHLVVLEAQVTERIVELAEELDGQLLTLQQADMIREALRDLVDDKEDVEDELRYLQKVLCR